MKEFAAAYPHFLHGADYNPDQWLAYPEVLAQEQIDRIESYVAGGGTAVATYATGYVDDTDLCYLGGFPGNQLKDVFGLTADEIDSLYETDKNAVLWDGNSYDVVDYCELITPTTAEVLGTYEKDFYAGVPAVLKSNRTICDMISAISVIVICGNTQYTVLK